MSLSSIRSFSAGAFIYRSQLVKSSFSLLHSWRANFICFLHRLTPPSKGTPSVEERVNACSGKSVTSQNFFLFFSHPRCLFSAPYTPPWGLNAYMVPIGNPRMKDFWKQAWQTKGTSIYCCLLNGFLWFQFIAVNGSFCSFCTIIPVVVYSSFRLHHKIS